MTVAIFGTTTFPRYDVVRELMGRFPAGTRIVSGGGPGVAEVAEQCAREQGLSMTIVSPQWNESDAAVVILRARNMRMVEMADAVVVFWDGHSPSMRQVISKAKKLRKKIRVVTATDKVTAPVITRVQSA